MSGTTGGNGKKPSIFEVAKRAGVSHQTVSRVINHSPDVAAATRRKVQEAIRKLGYRPSSSARALASHRSRTIGLIAGNGRDPASITMLSAIEATARARGFFLSVTFIDEAGATRRDFDEACECLISQNVEACIILASTELLLEYACAVNISPPRVVVTATHGIGAAGKSALRRLSARNAAVVGIDQWSAIHEVAVAVHGMGHRSAWYLAGPSQWRDAATRLLAWERCSAEYSIDSRTIRAQTWSPMEAYARINHYLEAYGERGGNLPTVIVTGNDNQAIGVARALHEHSIRIPKDVSLVGFDDIPAADSLYPPLCTVRPHLTQLGRAAVQEALALLGVIIRPPAPRSHHGVDLIPATFVQRNSLGQTPRR
ncbi:LacI family DNA-binding transcriptional regulator [Bifidobacterium crudilactis]|jgi:DNA-binding LacI/PurR family transcriptional regulator|uniref:LacI family DNA-binding transcriptional regulator n=1 Tax=Bifidobacterium crudilactis TaxID=327277 RepID=UPI00054D520E|nr:LacI family DNA-binding transcriptional regulator [Bifidobacterium crudilactis]MCI2157074.1 LacI family transcriptional regulator [Bifidobacterium crudilactis]